MLRQAWWTVCTLIVFGLLNIAHAPARATDAEIDRLLRSPAGKDWVTNGGNLTNNRYSTLKQIDTANVGKLKGAWMTRLKGSGVGGKYSFEASPLVKDGVMYVVTGNDDVFALNAKTGEGALVGHRPEDFDRVLRLGPPRPGDGRGAAVPQAKTGEYAWHFQEVHHDL